jgi:hypothetical protein
VFVLLLAVEDQLSIDDRTPVEEAIEVAAGPHAIAEIRLGNVAKPEVAGERGPEGDILAAEVSTEPGIFRKAADRWTTARRSRRLVGIDWASASSWTGSTGR